MMKDLNTLIKTAEMRKQNIYIGNDSLRYCARCNSPLQKIEYDNNQVPYIVETDCRCGELKAFQNIEKARNECFISPSMMMFRYDDNQATATNIKTTHPIRKFIRKFQKFKELSVGVYLYGSSSKDRIYNLSRICNGIIDRGSTRKYLSIPLLISQYGNKNCDWTTFFKKICKYDAVALSEFYIPYGHSEAQFLYSLIEILSESGVVLIISAEININEIKPSTNWGGKIKTLLKNKCVTIPLPKSTGTIDIVQTAMKELWIFPNEEMKYEE